ncbi:hypothetical protein Y032_0003g1638 [Ancylostoma ceylanicum]|uniref:Uncharacterized protein n=1 Tax=Ancylostoma ceylanicum TaxID=53326 RepID=A0A016VYA7_9BILA|nr:hypothetical protein Y032_0003g1638 [Ancylostoma ceylanicum]
MDVIQIHASLFIHRTIVGTSNRGHTVQDHQLSEKWSHNALMDLVCTASEWLRRRVTLPPSTQYRSST